MMPHMPAQNNNKKIVDITFCLIKEQMLQLKTALMTNITPIYQEKYYFYLFSSSSSLMMLLQMLVGQITFAFHLLQQKIVCFLSFRCVRVCS